MFKVGLELLEMSLNRLGKQKSRYIKNLPVGAFSLVGPDVRINWSRRPVL